MKVVESGWKRRRMAWHGWVVSALLAMAACGGDGATDADGPGPVSPAAPDAGPGSAGPTSSSGTGATAPMGAKADVGACAVVLTRVVNITVPTVWKNGPGDCDVYLDGHVNVQSVLTIEPGTTVRLAKDASFSVTMNASLTSVGRPDARIRFLGEIDDYGTWSGFALFGGPALTRFEYTDIENAGQIRVQEAAIKAHSTKLVFKHNRIAKSFLDGVIFLSIDLTEFEANVFEDNLRVGLVTNPEVVTGLDAATDYVGRARPNGQPYIKIGSPYMKTPATWRDLGTPYFATGGLHPTAPLTIEPGVTVIMEDRGDGFISGGGAIVAVGTAERPIVFTGQTKMPGAWQGLHFIPTKTSVNRFDHVRIEHGGRDSSIGVSGVGGTFTVANTIFVDFAALPMCDGASSPITLGPNVSASKAGVMTPVTVERCR